MADKGGSRDAEARKRWFVTSMSLVDAETPEEAERIVRAAILFKTGMVVEYVEAHPLESVIEVKTKRRKG